MQNLRRDGPASATPPCAKPTHLSRVSYCSSDADTTFVPAPLHTVTACLKWRTLSEWSQVARRNWQGARIGTQTRAPEPLHVAGLTDTRVARIHHVYTQPLNLDSLRQKERPSGNFVHATRPLELPPAASAPAMQFKCSFCCLYQASQRCQLVLSCHTSAQLGVEPCKACWCGLWGCVSGSVGVGGDSSARSTGPTRRPAPLSSRVPHAMDHPSGQTSACACRQTLRHGGQHADTSTFECFNTAMASPESTSVHMTASVVPCKAVMRAIKSKGNHPETWNMLGVP